MEIDKMPPRANAPLTFSEFNQDQAHDKSLGEAEATPYGYCSNILETDGNGVIIFSIPFFFLRSFSWGHLVIFCWKWQIWEEFPCLRDI